MTKSKTWKFDFFIGIDVSKLDLDLAVMRRNTFVKHYRVGNSPSEIMAFIKYAKLNYSLTIPKTVFGMEQTGIYCNHLLYCLEKLKANIVLDDANHIRNSLGIIRGKSDKVDAKRIAGYLVKGRDTHSLYNSKRPIIHELARLLSLRNRLISVQKILNTPLKEERSFLTKAASDKNNSICYSTISSLKNDIVNLEKYIEAVWKSDINTNRLMKLITSVPGVGPVTGLQIIVSTNEFKSISDSRKLACYSGVAPFEHMSGSSVKRVTRVSNMSNKRLKTLLHTCALSAKRYVPELKGYYDRKVGEGKHKMSVINAIRFKIIGRIFACINNDRLYQMDYDPFVKHNNNSLQS